MSSSTATISSSSTNAPMANNERKRPLSSSIRPSPSPPLVKRQGSASDSRRTEGNESLLRSTSEQNNRHIRSKPDYRIKDDHSPSSSTVTNLQKSTTDAKDTNEVAATKKLHSSASYQQDKKTQPGSDPLYTKKAVAISPFIKPSSASGQRARFTGYESDEELEETKQVSTKSTPAVIPSSVMAMVTPADSPKKSIRSDNVIIQQVDGNVNSNSSRKLVKLVAPQVTNASSIKMLSSGDSLASALRVPTKIQLTKTLYVSSAKPDAISSISSSNVLEMPVDLADKQQPSTEDYHATSALPPTPPPPVIDKTNSNVRNVLPRTSISEREVEEEEEEQTSNQLSPIHIKAAEETNSSTCDEQPSTSQHHSSSLSDWSVPPTSELSPTSLTSSSPDLTQTHVPADDLLVELDSTIDFQQSAKRRQPNPALLKPIKSQSLTHLADDSSQMKFMLIDNKRSLTASPVFKLLSSQRVRKRRRDNDNGLLTSSNEKIYKSKMKHIKLEDDTRLTVKHLLNDMIERIATTSGVKNIPSRKSDLLTFSEVQQTTSVDALPNNQVALIRTNSGHRKNSSSAQLLDSTAQNESRSMIIPQSELDELAYLLHANAHRSDYERMGNSEEVEERMREMWSQMGVQKKNSYYKRVIQIYKRPNRNVVIASSASAIGNTSLSFNDLTDNSNPSLLQSNPSSVELKRQASTPLSFHSIPSTIADDQSLFSPQESSFKLTILTDIINELIKGAKGLDRLSYSTGDFINSIQNFTRLSADKQFHVVKQLEKEVEKKCLNQLHRATIFWTQKIGYFADKHQINSTNESMNELTLIVKYFYLFVLSLNCRKQETEFETALTDLLNGNLKIINPLFCSPILTSIIEDLILRSSLASDYLTSQPIVINEIEYSLPFVRNPELENELLQKNETYTSTNPFSNLQDLEDFLSRCEHMTPSMPCYPMPQQQQSPHSSMYYQMYPPQYYYQSSSTPSPSSAVSNYYYNNPTAPYPNSQSTYPYGQSTSYYHPSTTYISHNNNNNNNNEQLKYYYNPQQQPPYPYPTQMNSTNDIPLPNNPSHHRTYRQVNSNIQRSYSNIPLPSATTTSGTAPPTPSTPAVADATTVRSPQAKSMNTTTNNSYPP